MIKHLVPRSLAGVALASLLVSGVISAPGGAASAPAKPAGVTATSCSSLGNCTGVGETQNASSFAEAAVTTEVNGVWGSAQPLTFANPSDTSGVSSLTSLVCTDSQDCTALGTAGSVTTDVGGLISATETSGVWGPAEDISLGSVSDANGGLGFIKFVCSSAGNCAALGDDNDGAPLFVTVESSGVWSTARQLVSPHAATLSIIRPTLTCTTSSTCKATALYISQRRPQPLMQVTYTESNGSSTHISLTKASNALACKYGASDCKRKAARHPVFDL